MADVKIDENANIYSLYWKRTHDRIFAKAFMGRDRSFYITKDNFNLNLTGTGAFIVPRNVFLRHAYSFDPKMILSDDNALIKRIVTECPILFNPEFYILWEPRKNFFSFVLRMFERGPGFVEFHVFKNKGTYFYIVLVGLISLLGLVTIIFNDLSLSIMISTSLLFGIALSTIFFSRSVKEFFLLLPIHVGTIIFFGLGIIWGLILNSWKYIKTRGSLGYSKSLFVL